VTRDFWGKTGWDGKPVTELVKGDIMRNGNNRHLNYQVNVRLEYALKCSPIIQYEILKNGNI
jgi:hypothetical protein